MESTITVGNKMKKFLLWFIIYILWAVTGLTMLHFKIPFEYLIVMYGSAILAIQGSE